MNKVKNILVLQSGIEILATLPGHGVPVCGFHTRPFAKPRRVTSTSCSSVMFLAMSCIVETSCVSQGGLTLNPCCLSIKIPGLLKCVVKESANDVFENFADY